MSVYNAPATFSLVLESIRLQNPPFDYEIVVVDDGSQYTCEDVCRSFGVKYIYDPTRPFYSSPGPGRNLALRSARGRIIIQQSAEVVHHTCDTIERLVNTLSVGHFDIATVFNVAIDPSGHSTPASKELTRVQKIMEYTGANNQRPLFFLGSVLRQDIYAVGGNDVDFVYPGYEDDWLAFCLMHGRGLTPRYRRDIVGYHLDHGGHPWSTTLHGEMHRLYQHKKSLGLFRTKDAPWPMEAV